MADNVAITAGAGTTIASDDIGGVQHQRVKVGSGADGVYNDASATNPLPALLYDAAGSVLLPAASALADNMANPTTTRIGACLMMWDGIGWNRVITGFPNVDGYSAGIRGIVVLGFNHQFNGTTWDRIYSNIEGTLLASAARTATTSSAAQTNRNAHGVMIFLNITIASGLGGIKIRLLGRDPVSGADVFLNADPTPITATGLYAYELYPAAGTAGVAGAGNVQQRTQAVLPRTWLVQVTHMDASSYTYSVGYAQI